MRHVRLPILVQLVALIKVDEIRSNHNGARLHNALVRELGEWVWLRFVVEAAFGLTVDSLVLMPALSIYEAYLAFLGKQFFFTLAEALQSRNMYEKLLRAYDTVTNQDLTNQDQGRWTPSAELQATVDQRKVQVQEMFMKSYRTQILSNVVLCLVGAWPCMAAGIYETFFPALLAVINLVNVLGQMKQLRAARKVEELRRREAALSRLKKQNSASFTVKGTKVAPSSRGGSALISNTTNEAFSSQVGPSSTQASSNEAAA